MDIEGIRKHCLTDTPLYLWIGLLLLSVSIEAYKTEHQRAVLTGISRVIPYSRRITRRGHGSGGGLLGFVTMGKTPEDGSIYYLVGTDKLRFKRPCAGIGGTEASIVSEKRGIGSLMRASVDG